jgi:hypothetical protein
MRHLFLLLALAAACSRSGSDAAFSWTTPLDSGTTIHIRDGAGSITVRRTAANTAVVRGSRSWHRGRASDIKFAVTQKGNDYFICAMWRNSGKCGASGYRGRNTMSFLSMFSLFHRTTDAAADFDVELPSNVKLDTRTSTGSITIDGATAGVAARTVSGTIRADHVSGPLDLQSTNGDVRVSIDGVGSSDAIRLLTTNGSIHAELPGDLQGLYDLSVMNGVVSSDIPLSPGNHRGATRQLAGQIGTSTRVVKMRAGNGSVTVTKKSLTTATGRN